ncbi:c-type cytochrome [Flavobacterium pedocola]
MRVRFLLLTASFITLTSCSSDSESDLYGEIPEQITYNNTVKAIINNNCIMCHNQPPVNGAPMPLINYDFVKAAIISRGLIDRISRPQGAPGMMPNGGTRLPQSEIDKIIAWKNANYPE